MGLFDFLKRNKNKQVDNNSNTMEGELPEEVLEKVNNYGSEGFKEELKNSEEPKNSRPKESIHDANWRENSQPAARPGFVRYRFDDALRGGEVTKEYMPSPNSKISVSEEEKTDEIYIDDEEQHKSK